MKAVHLHCLSVLISHFVRLSLMYPTVNEWLVAVLPNSFPAKIALTRVRMQTLANFTLCSAQIVGQFGHLQVGLHGFHCHVQLAVINISHKRTGLCFEYANNDIHLPKNPLALIVNGLCFSPSNVFSIRCILGSLGVLLICGNVVHLVPLIKQ